MVLAIALQATGLPALAQSILIPATVSCKSCRITVDSIAAIVGLGLESAPNTLRRSASGNLFAISDKVLKQFDVRGKLVRQIGRSGGGPGEYENIRNTLVAGDGTLHLIDASLSRHSVYAADGKFLTSSPLALSGGMGLDAALWGRRRLVVNVRADSKNRSSLIVVDSLGVTSFLPDEVALEDVRRRWLHRRLLSVRANGDLLVARPYTFELDLYTPRMKRRGSMLLPGRKVKAPAPLTEPSDAVFDEPFTPMVGGLWEDEAGRVWVLTVIPHPEWKPVARPSAGTQLGADRMAAMSQRPRIQFQVEVLSPNLNRVLSRQLVPVSIGMPIGEGYFASAEADESGEPVMRISRLKLMLR